MSLIRKLLLAPLLAAGLLLGLGLPHLALAAVSATFFETPDAVNGVTGDSQKMFWASTSGSMTYTTAVTFAGVGAWKMDSAAGAQAFAATTNTVLSDAGTRFTGYINFGTSVASGQYFLQVRDAANGFCFGLQYNSAGKIDLVGNTTLKTGTTVINTGTWPRLAMGYTVTSTTNYTINVYLNSVLEYTATGANGNLQRSGTAQLNLGWNNAPPAANLLFYFQHIYVDNGTDRADLGNTYVTAKRPVSNGTTNGWLVQRGSGGSGYGSGHAPQVNERPLNTANGWKTLLLSTTEEYSIEGAGIGDLNAGVHPLRDSLGWVYADVGSGTVTAQMIFRGATSSIGLTITPTLFTKLAGNTTYPGGATDIGIISSGSAGTETLYEAGVVVAFNPDITFTSGNFLLLGVGP